MPAPRERAFIIVRAPNGDVREVAVGRGAIVVGRDDSADIRVDDKKVSRRHAAFKLMDGEIWVEDLGSSNGVRINGKRIDKRAPLRPGEQIRVGGYFIELAPQPEASVASQVAERPTSGTARVAAPERTPRVAERRPPPDDDAPVLFGLDPPVKGERFVLSRGENVVGRLEECDVPILDGSVSRQHARLVFSRDRVTVTDLGSSNGIFVNEVRVDMAELADGDRLRIGNIAFQVKLPKSLASAVGAAPLATRAKARPVAKPGGRRWMILGAAGLFLAAFVATTAVFLRLRAGVGKETTSSAFAFAGEPKGAEVPGEVMSPPAPAPAPGPGVAAAPPPAERPPKPAGPAAKAQAAPKLALAGTATSPFGRRGPDGLPLALPAVDGTLDFDAFVAEKAQVAAACQEKADLACVQETVKEWLRFDPINATALALRRRVEVWQTSEKALVDADALVAQGKFGQAFRLLMDVAADIPQAEQAKERAEKLKTLALEDEVALAKKEAGERGGWLKAHARYRWVLELDPGRLDALDGLREVEKKLRGRNVEFAAYEPGTRRGPKEEGSDNAQVIAQHWDGDATLAGVAQLYARGALPKALERARSLERSSSGQRKRQAKELTGALERIQKLYERTRTEISNNPEQAWAMLLELQRVEAKVLPRRVKSFVARELEVSLSEAFAELGASLFDQGRDEEAFQRWESGYKLDATNPRVSAGLKKLEERAVKHAQEAELAAQRGERDVCQRWKRITRMTRAGTEVHQKAKERALATCR